MTTLTCIITETTRTNPLTSTSASVKTVACEVDGVLIAHGYVFDGATTDVDCKASAKADLEGAKGYGALTEI